MNLGLAFRAGKLAAVALGAILLAPTSLTAAPAAAPIKVSQGADWTVATARDFYSRDQGSRVMPLPWIVALKQANGQPFMADSLGRYGYLPNEASDPPGLPVGFTVSGGGKGEYIGMTCAACHTRQIDVAGNAYRIDGGPAIVDFQSFLADLDAAVNNVLSDKQAFADFAHAVLGPSPPPDKEAKLRVALAEWFLPYHTIIQRALPKDPWGVARVDAVGMIFNRLTGVDIGTAPNHIIAENIRPATAPTRYPFLWNAPVQDKTQWPGFADNGNDILGLARNLGEVYGVFAVFHPQKDSWRLLGIDYLDVNSANFHGLGALEDLIRKLGPPKWPWPVDLALASKGQKIYERNTADGGCAQCHGIKPGVTRFFDQKTWATPVQDVGTDSREYDILAWTAKTGVLEGASIPLLTDPLKPVDQSFNILRLAVLGSILQHYVPIAMDVESKAQKVLPHSPFTLQTQDLKGAFNPPQKSATPQFAYEARVLEGVWAVAPYLHNGSVPTLAELLKPAKDRVAAFKVGPAYDIVSIGLGVDQTRFDYTLTTTDCSERNSGNSRCGHEFGTTLLPDEKQQLLEYLKTL